MMCFFQHFICNVWILCHIMFFSFIFFFLLFVMFGCYIYKKWERDVNCEEEMKEKKWDGWGGMYVCGGGEEKGKAHS